MDTLALQAVCCAKETVISIHVLKKIYPLFNQHCYLQLSCSTPAAWQWYPDGSPPQSLGSPQPPWQQEPRRLPPCPHASLRCASSTPLWMPGAGKIMMMMWWWLWWWWGGRWWCWMPGAVWTSCHRSCRWPRSWKASPQTSTQGIEGGPRGSHRCSSSSSTMRGPQRLRQLQEHLRVS